MKIPKKVIKGNKEYVFIREYEKYVLYENEAGYKECFNKQDLGLIKQIVEATRKVNPEVKI